MGKLYDTRKKQERCVLVAAVPQGQKEEQAQEYLDELSFLVLTAGGKVIKRFMQRVTHPNPKTYVGEGKLEEIANYVKDNEADAVIFDDELTPSQIRNVEKVLNCKILDRTNLILDIFAANARTAQARFQVELAQAQYLFPRLTRMWTHLTKHAGGIGMKGPGETEIETDRRVLRGKITKLKERLAVVDRQSETRRKNREGIVRVALVGYTNVGKSTVLNLLTKSDVLAENKLFATLDSTVRKVVFDNVLFLLTDTVGFIRKLPHQLIECFKSTLDEIREADLLVHVVDVSHPNFEEQLRVVNQTLEEIGANKTPRLLVFNKIDELQEPLTPDPFNEGPQDPYIDRLRNTWIARENTPVVFISATRRINIDELRDTLKRLVSEIAARGVVAGG
jgi:GTP-binding protein HflX